MVDAVHADLSISAQCRLLLISRSSFYYTPQPESHETLALMRVIDAAFLVNAGRIPGQRGGVKAGHC